MEVVTVEESSVYDERTMIASMRELPWLVSGRVWDTSDFLIVYYQRLMQRTADFEYIKANPGAYTYKVTRFPIFEYDVPVIKRIKLVEVRETDLSAEDARKADVRSLPYGGFRIAYANMRDRVR